MNQKSSFLKELEELRLNNGESNKFNSNYTYFLYREINKLRHSDK